ncbi:MAG: DUF6261 family protein [Tannerellaceae bacterium]|jgi:hypothetical protein|nr:DUF6261 family protein [Tannerellaceae bacterium]
MKVLRIHQKSLHNEEWFNCYADFKDELYYFDKDTLGIKDLYASFLPLYNKADKLLEVLRKCIYTKDVEEVDKRRDDILRGLCEAVKGSQMSPADTVREAAARLYNLLDGYRKLILKGSLAEESAAIRNLLQELDSDAYAGDVGLLGLNEWVVKLGNAERDFLKIRDRQKLETSNRLKEDLRLTRGRTDALYTVMVNTLDARLQADGLGGDIVVEPEDLDLDEHASGEAFTPEVHGNVTYNFVIAWNDVVKKYRNLIAQRRAKAGSSYA